MTDTLRHRPAAARPRRLIVGWSLVSGHWYNGPGQVDVSTAFAADTGRTTGDSVTLTVNGNPVMGL